MRRIWGKLARRNAHLHLVLLDLEAVLEALELGGEIQELLVPRHGIRHHLESAHDLLQLCRQLAGRRLRVARDGAPRLPSPPRSQVAVAMPRHASRSAGNVHHSTYCDPP